MADDLFAAAAEDTRNRIAPLADRLRPTSLGDVLGQQHLLGAGRPLRRWTKGAGQGSIVLWGPPGTGKTTIARVLVRELGAAFEPLSAVNASVADVRRVAEQATRRLGEQGSRTVLFLDEIHRFTRTQQDALLPHVESGLLTLIGATTESPWATVNRPLLSRCTVHRLEPLNDHDLATLVDRGAEAARRTIDEPARRLLIDSVGGDGRRLLVGLEAAAGLTETHIDVEVIREALGAGGAAYGRSAHYDAASALIKHLRNSDEDQALAWMVHMLDGGEDPRFVARRLVIFASEDIGVADRSALLIATAASAAVDSVGLPECRYALAHAVIVLARAPKSRDVGEAMARVAALDLQPPPNG